MIDDSVLSIMGVALLITLGPWARIGHSAPPPPHTHTLLIHTKFYKALICPKHEMRC